MARITLDEIVQELSEKNWKVLSDEYQNLDTEMTFECEEGHKIYMTWRRLRTKCECPVCKQNIFKENKPIILEKNKNEYRILALDQATHNTGWSIFDGDKLIKYGIYEAKGISDIERFYEIRNWLISMITSWDIDFIGLEGIQYQANFGVTTFETLARLQGILMETCYELEIPFQIVPTNTWRAHCNVKGKTRSDKKQSMQRIIKTQYDISISDDCADAIGIGKYFSETNKKRNEIINWE